MAKLTFEINLKTIKKFIVLSEIDITPEQEAQLNDSEVTVSESELMELIDDKNALLAFAGIIASKTLTE